MSKKTIKRCDHCGAKMVEYPHILNKNIINALVWIYKQGGVLTMKASEGKLTFNQKNNFQKLQYWGLIEKVFDDQGQREGGAWAMTYTGGQFVEGRIMVHRKVWTYRNAFVRFDGEQVKARDITDYEYMQGPDYSAAARPRFVNNNGQLEFFEGDRE